jgi:signal transduction histidine kinase
VQAVVIDDDTQSASALADCLQQNDLRVGRVNDARALAAESLRDALVVVVRGAFNTLVDALVELRRGGCSAAMFLIAKAPLAQDQVERVYALGAADVLVDPFSTSVFRARVRALTGAGRPSVAKAVRSRLPLAPEWTDVDSMIAESVARLRRRKDNTAIRVHSLAEPVAAYLDPVRIGQVVRTLIASASNHPDGARVIDVVVTRSDTELHITIRDHGPAEGRTRVSETFPVARDDDAGSEFDLGLTREIVAACGGSLATGTTSLGGAEFVVGLPVLTRALAGAPLLRDGSSRADGPAARTARTSGGTR